MFIVPKSQMIRQLYLDVTFSLGISIHRIVGRVDAVNQVKLDEHNRPLYNILQVH